MRAVSLLLLSLLVVSGCGQGTKMAPNQPPSSTPVPVSVKVTPSSANVIPDATLQFSATVTFSDGSTNTDVTWSATGAGTINSTGLFTATTIGSAAVVASAPSDPTILMTVNVTVSNAIGGKWAGLLTGNGGSSGMGCWFAANLMENTAGTLTTPGFYEYSDVNNTGQPNFSTMLSLYPLGEVTTGSQNGTSFQASFSQNENVNGNMISSGNLIVSGNESTDATTLSGGYTGSYETNNFNTDLENLAQCGSSGTFTLSQYPMLNGTWSGSGAGQGQYTGWTANLTLSLSETVTEGSNGPLWNFSGQITYSQTNPQGGTTIPETYTIDENYSASSGNLLVIGYFAPPANTPTCGVEGQINDTTGNTLTVTLGATDCTSAGVLSSLPSTFTLTKQN